jgi:hypothetical protein
MNTDRLLRLADLLEANAANPTGVKFDLETWAIPAGYDVHTAYSTGTHAYAPDTETIPLDCNTVACAMGLAAISGVFKDDGLDWKISDSGWLVPVYGKFIDGFQAAEAFFDVEYRATEHLFDASFYPDVETKGSDGELAVAQRIRDFVAGRYTLPVDEDD